MASFLTAVRESYDTVAAEYVERVPPPAEMDPLSCAMLAGFAKLVRTAGLGPVADLGCGRITAHLARLGVTAFGVDLSPKMIGLARRVCPDLRFAEGSMTALETGDDELGGILAWYSTHHTPPQWLPAVFAEFHRTLAPGAFLLWETTSAMNGCSPPTAMAVQCPTSRTFCPWTTWPVCWSAPDSSSPRDWNRSQADA